MFFKDYIEYLRDNPQKYWFKAKIYGWGWTPVRWQGWLTMAIFIGLMVLNAYRLDARDASTKDALINFIPETTFLVIVLIAICYKTGEKPHWQWGFPKKKDDDFPKS